MNFEKVGIISETENSVNGFFQQSGKSSMSSQKHSQKLISGNPGTTRDS
jgi:hypothetical protein